MELTDAEALARSIEDPAAFVQVFDRHGRAVHAYLSRRAGAAADDLLADVWLHALRARHRYNQRWPDARPWLYGIARNVLRAHWRSGARGLGTGADVAHDPWSDVDAQLDARRAAPHLRRALASLPDADREVLLMVAWEGLTPAEVATSLSMPSGTVRWRLHRAKASLRRQLGAGATGTRFQTAMEV